MRRASRVEAPPTAKQIRAARVRSGLTQAVAGAYVGYSRRTWQDWERGVTRMRPFVFATFQRMTGIDRERG